MVMASDECALSVVVAYGILYRKFRFKSFFPQIWNGNYDFPEPAAILQLLLQMEAYRWSLLSTSNVSRQRNRRWT
jgi:hypothetical protein